MTTAMLSNESRVEAQGTPPRCTAAGRGAPTARSALGTPGPQPACSPADQPRSPRRYIYCLVDCDAPAGLGSPPPYIAAGCPFGPMGIEGNSEVFAVAHDSVAAVVSATSAEKLEISRGNTLAHQRVMETVMQRGHTVLPVKFNTIAEDKGRKSAEERIVDHVLVGRNKEIVGLLSTMRPLVELGVKGLWTDMEAVFRNIVETSPEIQSLRKRLMATTGPGASGKRPANMTGQIRLGELVKKALEARKCDMEASLLGRLAPLVKDSRLNKTFGDPMFANLALLVDKSRQNDVVAALSAFEAQQAGKVKLRCVGPLPPCNFLELVITWDD